MSDNALLAVALVCATVILVAIIIAYTLIEIFGYADADDDDKEGD